jgi:cytochrome P450
MSRCRKGPWYAGSAHIGAASTHTCRDKEEHKRRRKAWDHAFNSKALREYEPRLDRHALALMSRLKEQAKQPSVRFTNWVNYYSFDVMGDVGFSRSFGMMEKGEEDPVIKLLHESMSPLSIFGHLNWALNLATRTEAGAKALVDHIDWTAKVLEERAKVRASVNVLVSTVLSEPRKPLKKTTSSPGSSIQLLPKSRPNLTPTHVFSSWQEGTPVHQSPHCPLLRTRAQY